MTLLCSFKEVMTLSESLINFISATCWLKSRYECNSLKMGPFIEEHEIEKYSTFLAPNYCRNCSDTIKSNYDRSKYSTKKIHPSEQ